MKVTEYTKDRTGWGKLPPQDIAKAKSAIQKKLPPQYRRAINAYTRELAKQQAKNNK